MVKKLCVTFSCFFFLNYYKERSEPWYYKLAVGRPSLGNVPRCPRGSLRLWDCFYEKILRSKILFHDISPCKNFISIGEPALKLFNQQIGFLFFGNPAEAMHSRARKERLKLLHLRCITLGSGELRGVRPYRKSTLQTNDCKEAINLMTTVKITSL